MLTLLYDPTLTSMLTHLTTEKTITMTRWAFIGRVMSLLLNILSRFGIDFLPRSKHLLISWLQSSSAVILEPKKIKSATVSIVSPSICHEVMGQDAMILVFWMLNFKSTFFYSSLSPSSRGKQSNQQGIITNTQTAHVPQYQRNKQLSEEICRRSK